MTDYSLVFTGVFSALLVLGLLTKFYLASRQIRHDQGHQHGRQRRRAVGEFFLDAVLGCPDRRMPKALAQGLRREPLQRHAREVVVDTQHRNAARVKLGQRFGGVHGRVGLSGLGGVAKAAGTKKAAR